MNNKCKICGAPCRIKYCTNCRDEAYRESGRRSHKRVKREKYNGCKEDCFNCPYSDCLKPVSKMHTDLIYKEALMGGR